MQYLKKTWVEINLDHLEYNYRALRAAVPEAKFLGIVKADAYGHGAVPVSRCLQELGAEVFAVSNLDEAIQLRRGGIERPILILGYTPPEFAIELSLLGIWQEVHSLEYARLLSTSLPHGQTLGVHLKLDTGMSRLGFFAYDRPETVDEIVEISHLPHLKIEGTLQHFAVADSRTPEDRAFTALQYERFTAMLDALTARGVNCGLRHCCNSAGVIDYPQYAMDMVRPGIATYGLAPSDDLRGALELRPLLSWRTSICQLRDFEPGVDISYGRTYTTTRPTRVAVLSVGYADGLCRTLSGRVELLLHGRRVPVIGRICMDMCMADVTEVPEAQVGDAVTIIGSDGAETITADEFAGLLGTISYEAICDIGKRVPRIYYRDGKVTEELRYIV